MHGKCEYLQATQNKLVFSYLAYRDTPLYNAMVKIIIQERKNELFSINPIQIIFTFVTCLVMGVIRQRGKRR